MPKIEYRPKGFHNKSLEVIDTANNIIDEYQAEGYSLTLRQVYYQFIARDCFPTSWFDALLQTYNTQKNYGKLGILINKGRLAGLVDWNAITDRTRVLRKNNHFNNPQDILKTAAHSYRIDTRADQEYYLEVWIEKDALVGVIEQVCSDSDVPYFSCRGYVSQSAMWEAAQRINSAVCWNDTEKYMEKGIRKAIIIHLGDHDPSGVHMSEDIQNRLTLFGTTAKVDRIALTIKQVKKYKPPPNPTKEKDTRSGPYIKKYGKVCWELDALDPKTLISLIETAVKKYTEADKREELLNRQTFEKSQLQYVSDNWQDLDIEVDKD